MAARTLWWSVRYPSLLNTDGLAPIVGSGAYQPRIELLDDVTARHKKVGACLWIAVFEDSKQEEEEEEEKKKKKEIRPFNLDSWTQKIFSPIPVTVTNPSYYCFTLS